MQLSRQLHLQISLKLVAFDYTFQNAVKSSTTFTNKSKTSSVWANKTKS